MDAAKSLPSDGAVRHMVLMENAQTQGHLAEEQLAEQAILAGGELATVLIDAIKCFGRHPRRIIFWMEREWGFPNDVSDLFVAIWDFVSLNSF